MGRPPNSHRISSRTDVHGLHGDILIEHLGFPKERMPPSRAYSNQITGVSRGQPTCTFQLRLAQAQPDQSIVTRAARLKASLRLESQ